MGPLARRLLTSRTPPRQPADSAQEVEVEAAWGMPARSEPPWYPALAVLAAMVLWRIVPVNFAIQPVLSWVVTGLEAVLLLPLVYVRRPQGEHASLGGRMARGLSIGLIAIITAANLISLIQLIHLLLTGTHINGGGLLRGAGSIWGTNVIVFGLWYWELDRGGPLERFRRTHRQPDFLFPQMVSPFSAPRDWAPDFVDYLYVSFTNATAFSPTDTMPLTNWAKLLMMIQALASLISVGLVAARAVNILPS